MTPPSNAVTLRTSMPTDAAALRELRLEALRLHPEAFSADVTTNEREPLSFWVERASHAADDPEQVIYFAVVDGELIGMAGVRRGASPKTAHSAILWGVYVRPAWRGQRIVDQLVQGVLGWAGQQQVQLVKLAVIVTNTTAIRSYRRCGFSVYGVEPQAICYNGRCYDELLMVQQL